ncbi:Hypothetical protein PHPALM_8953 [Phytophthora palmivora]|uniref:Uncharacterized protein n=1 Tax=Phytophthora palmivora TaxID=4796 RepID=A0A2P4Y8Y1_9STRA|nr:Hypothetical protein PHPALM_8953 [Phytophthora palmivora]
MPSFQVDADGDVEMSVPQPVYEFVSAPELTAWDQESLVNWKRERERYVEKIQQKCRTSNEPFDAAVMRVRDTVKPKVLKHLARYVLRKPIEDITDADIMAKVRERTSTLQNGHIPDVQAFFKANLRMDLAEKDIDARILKYYVDFEQLVEDHGFGTMLGVGSSGDDGYRDRMKQRCKLLMAGLAPMMLKVEIERLVLLQNKDARTDDVALYDLILQRATAQQHYHLMQLEEKPDKRVATAGIKKNSEPKAKAKPSDEPPAKQKEKKLGPREGCWICKGAHFAQQCPTATEAQKDDAKKRLGEARAKAAKAARISKSPGQRRVVLNEVLEIPFRPDSGADCCFLPEEYLKELQAVDSSVQATKLDHPVRVELAGTEEEFLVGDDLLKSLGIDVDGMMEQLAGGVPQQEDGDDLDDEPEIGNDESDSVVDTLGALLLNAEMQELD